MKQNDIINLHRIKTNNIGDLVCSPAHYFTSLKNAIELDLLGYRTAETESAEERAEWNNRVTNAGAIIIGGGGLLGIDFFSPGLQKVFELKTSACKTILWGAGHNKWELGDWRELKFKVDLSHFSFDLIGIRDHNQIYDWVPCVSCMALLFDSHRSADIKREVGLYIHADTFEQHPKFSRRIPRGIEMIDNNSDFPSVIEYLSSSNLVITDSYHGMYWATLLGRKVVAFPSSSKFYDLRYPAPLCAPDDWERSSRLARIYPEALAECRASNIAFARRVDELLGL